MRTVWLTAIGGPEVLVPGEAQDPVPGPGQALVHVAYANITFIETQTRSGRGPFKVEPPMILGNGVGGTVAAVGDGVDEAVVGKRVISSLQGSGGYAEKALAPAENLIVVPSELELDAAVALLADGRTAVMLTEAAAVRPGDRVIVEAAAGGVGTLLVQLAKSAGATVIALAGGEPKLQLVRELGADLAVDYRSEDWPEAVRREAGGADVVFDGVGGSTGRRAFELLAPGGRMLSFGLASGEWAGIAEAQAAERGVRLVSAGATPDQLRAFVVRALQEAAAGRLRPVIGQRFALEDAAKAHEAIESRATLGKTLLEV